MKISIIIPVYNVEPYISRCIDSVLEQTYKDIEVIVVDDCSPDNSIEIARNTVSKHINKDKVVFTEHQTNRGLSAARNTGINLASGEYIYFLDSDDGLPLDAIQTLVTIATKYKNPDIVVGNFELIGNDQRQILQYELPDLYTDSPIEILKLYENEKCPTAATNKLIKTNCIKEFNLLFEEGLLHEDVLWSMLLANRVQSMGIINKNTYNYYIRDGSITAKVGYKNINSYLKIINKLRRELGTTSLPYNKSNNNILKNMRNTALKRLFFLDNVEDQLYFFQQIKSIRITGTSLPPSKKIIDLILILPTKISFLIFRRVIR